jgi:hypothetical protein
MLTKHNYLPIDNAWDQETILKCCNPDKPEDTTCTDCCYDSWQTELKTVITKYNKAVESSTQQQNMVNFITDRRDRYKTWIDELTKAESLSLEVCYQLRLIAVQTDKIWYNSCKAVEAIEVLFCMIRDVFSQADKIKSMYDSLQNCISRTTDPSLVSNQGILQSLGDYKQKLDAALKTREDIIKGIIEAIRLANLIQTNISTKECPCGDDSKNPCPSDSEPCVPLTGGAYYGFKTIICEWYNAFACDSDCSDASTQQGAGKSKYSGSTQHSGEVEADCCLQPTFDFPICKNSFKSDVEGWFKSDDDQLKTLTIELNKVKIEKETLLACKTSLDNAIKATDPKLRCK